LKRTRPLTLVLRDQLRFDQKLMFGKLVGWSGSSETLPIGL
jgi:hypothetical protein